MLNVEKEVLEKLKVPRMSPNPRASSALVLLNTFKDQSRPSDPKVVANLSRSLVHRLSYPRDSFAYLSRIGK